MVKQEELKGDLARTSAYLQGEVKRFKEKARVAEEARAKEEARARAAEVEVPPLKKALAEALAEVPPLKKQLAELAAEVKVLERQVEEERKQLAPLRAQAAALSGARAEAAAAQAQLKAKDKEIEDAKTVSDGYLRRLVFEEAMHQVLIRELQEGIIDAALTEAIGQYVKMAGKRDEVQQLADEAAKQAADQVKMLRSSIKNHEEKYKALLTTMDKTDQGAAMEKRARVEAQAMVRELEEKMLQKQAEVRGDQGSTPRTRTHPVPVLSPFRRSSLVLCQSQRLPH